MNKQQLKDLIKETISEIVTEESEPAGLKGATVIQVMKSDDKVYLRLKAANSGVLFDAVLV